MMRETLLERHWRLSSGCGPFSVTRHEGYHSTYGCSFRLPVLKPVIEGTDETGSSELTTEWVRSALEAMVREEGSGRHEGVQPISKWKTVTISDEVVYDLLTHYETRIAFGERTEAILEDRDLWQPADKIAALLRDPVLGNKKNGHDLTKAEIGRGVDAARSCGGPLVFLLPAFPFKDQNPFRSDLPPDVPDFGEIATLIHLHCLALAINQVFRHDVMWLVVSDGTVYEDIFGIEHGSASRYVSALRDWRSRLNIGGSIHFIDLQELVNRHDEESRSTPQCSFSILNQRMTEILRSELTSDDLALPSSIRSNLYELARGMLWNRGWVDAVRQYGLDALWEVHLVSCDKERLDPKLHPVAIDLWSLAVETAIRYAAFNLTSRYTRLLQHFMPSAIRATSHVKPGQVGIPRETGVAPWNGVAVFEGESNAFCRVRSSPLCLIPPNPKELVRFRLNSDKFGFGFASPQAIERYLSRS